MFVARPVDPALSFLSVALAAYDDGPAVRTYDLRVYEQIDAQATAACMARGL